MYFNVDAVALSLLICKLNQGLDELSECIVAQKWKEICWCNHVSERVTCSLHLSHKIGKMYHFFISLIFLWRKNDGIPKCHDWTLSQNSLWKNKKRGLEPSAPRRTFSQKDENEGCLTYTWKTGCWERNTRKTQIRPKQHLRICRTTTQHLKQKKFIRTMVNFIEWYDEIHTYKYRNTCIYIIKKIVHISSRVCICIYVSCTEQKHLIITFWCVCTYIYVHTYTYSVCAPPRQIGSTKSHTHGFVSNSCEHKK